MNTPINKGKIRVSTVKCIGQSFHYPCISKEVGSLALSYLQAGNNGVKMVPICETRLVVNFQ